MAIFPQGSAKKDTTLPFGKDDASTREPTPAVADFQPAEAPFQTTARQAPAAPPAPPMDDFADDDIPF